MSQTHVTKPTPGSLLVRAGAGAGKTTSLVSQLERFVSDFKKREGRLPRVVVTTFTRKATHELKERILRLALNQPDREFLDFATQPSLLFITTLHGLFGHFLTQYGYEFGLAPGFKIVDDGDSFREAKRLCRSLLSRQTHFQPLLQFFSIRELTHILETLFSLRRKWPNLSFITEEEIAKAHREITSGWIKGLKEYASSIDGQTDRAEWKKLSQLFSQWALTLADSPWKSAREQILTDLNGFRKPAAKRTQQGKAEYFIDEELHQRIGTLLKELKELSEPLHDPSWWSLYPQVAGELDDLFREFEPLFWQYKLKSGCLTAEDLETFSYELCRSKPLVAQRFSEQWDYWQLDEFQDTSPLQIGILNFLTAQKPQFLVGDPQQSIYLFRGSRQEVFEATEELFAKENQSASLSENYRSTPALLSFINDFFKNLNFHPMKPGNLGRPNDLQPIDPQPKETVATFVLFDSMTRSSEFQAIASHVAELQNKGAKLDQICILSRTNQSLFELGEFLNELKIPTHIHSAARFYDRREILDALSFLKFLINPHDNSNLLELLRSPWFCISDSQLVAALSGSKESSYWDYFARTSGGPKMNSNQIDSKVISQLNNLLEATEVEGIGEVFGRALIDFGFFTFSHFHDSTGRREANLWKLIYRLRSEESQAGFSYSHFIQKALAQLDPSQSEGDAVAAIEPACLNLMTIHGAKGLEFDHVILMNVTKGLRAMRSQRLIVDEETQKWSLALAIGPEELFTHSPAAQQILERWRERELAEQDRLLYVALTRARKSILLSGSEAIDANSWIARSGWPIDPGPIERDQYAYDVIREIAVTPS